MDTLCRISVDTQYAHLLPDAEKMVRRYEAQFSRHVANSFVSQLNNVGYVTSEELAAILQSYSELPPELSDVFSLYLGAITDAWNIAGGGTVPSSETLCALAANARKTTISIKNDQLRREGTGVIDLGGLLKGYLCGELAEYFDQHGVKRYVIDLGGNIAAYSKKPYTWKIGIKNPDGEGIVGYIQSDKQKFFVATSGNYQRYFERGGVRYHHILLPSTGYPARGVKSVTVITENPLLSDILSTALFVAGLEYPKYSADIKDRFAAVMIFENNEFTQYNTRQEHDEKGYLFWRY